MFKKISIAIGIVVGLFLIYVALQPAEYTISRELLINASSETLFPYINNSEQTSTWMPWKESDPKAVMTYSGPAEGVDSKSSWDSEGSMGTGEALVIESIPLLSVKTQLTYIKPMEMKQLAEIKLKPTDGGTVVHWSVSGSNPFWGRVFCVLFNMPKMIEGEFDKGLNNLKKMVEHDPR